MFIPGDGNVGATPGMYDIHVRPGLRHEVYIMYDLWVLLQWLIIFIAHAVCLECTSVFGPPHKPTVYGYFYYLTYK